MSALFLYNRPLGFGKSGVISDLQKDNFPCVPEPAYADEAERKLRKKIAKKRKQLAELERQLENLT